MNDEIIEILDFKENADYKRLSCDEIKVLKDYITNLQQENERLKQPQVFIDTQDMEERYGEELYKDYLKERLEDYKSRCEKAIEYIKEHIRIDDEYPDYMEMLIEERDNLLNILQNGSDNDDK